MATTSYLQETAGGMVAAGAFEDDDAAVSAVRLLRESGVQAEDISVIARNRRRAELIAGDRAWLPGKGWSGVMARLQRFRGGLPKEITGRYKKAIRSGQIVVVAVSGDQPPDTIAALMRQARGDLVDMWWQQPTLLFAPPELAGPF